MDLRVLTRIEGIGEDLANGEFAGSLPGEKKYGDDHVKTLRESKVLLDNIVNRQYFKRSETRRLIAPCFQASVLDGEIKLMKLSAPGLYTVQHFGTVPVPNNELDLAALRKKCIPRLHYLKKHTIKNAGILAVVRRRDV